MFYSSKRNNSDTCVILRFCILYVFAYSPKYIDIRDLFVIINTYSEYNQEKSLYHIQVDLTFNYYYSKWKRLNYSMFIYYCTYRT